MFKFIKNLFKPKHIRKGDRVNWSCQLGHYKGVVIDSTNDSIKVQFTTPQGAKSDGWFPLNMWKK